VTILNVGISDKVGIGNFWICEGLSVWNSFLQKIASRTGRKHQAIEIETRPFSKILDEYGVPFYLKIDIEGIGYLCIRDLADRPLPPFLSVESENAGDNEDLSNSEASAGRKLCRPRETARAWSITSHEALNG
jgi:hypothetical protein